MFTYFDITPVILDTLVNNDKILFGFSSNKVLYTK